jgi:MFS family permease
LHLITIYQTAQQTNMSSSKSSAKSLLGLVALFLGELRDGLTMINMQSAFLISSKFYSEKQVGIMFFVFGMSQFLFQTPAGYIMDYSDRKVALLAGAALATTALTVLTAVTAKEYGENIVWMVILKFIQGGVTALIPPGLNSITQGIVGSTGMTHQVADNEMKNHFGTAIIVLSGSVIAFYTYPNIGLLFIVSPIACAGVIFFLMRISPGDIDHDAARGLKSDADANATDYKLAIDVQSPHPTPPGHEPSFNWASAQPEKTTSDANTPTTPLELLRNKTLLVFTVICFLFHMSNGTVLPLVMQTLAIGGDKPRVGFLLSGMCIIVAQIFMVGSAKVCGDYSGRWGRKKLFLIGMFSVPIRCFILFSLTGIKNRIEAGGNSVPLALEIVILSTQILDGVGAGVFGTMYILVTSDIAAGTGRFSLTLGVTSAAMSIGGTVSGYLGQALAQDLGYQTAFMMLCVLSLVPALAYTILMPETLVIENGNHSVKDTEVTNLESVAENEEKQVV